MKQQTFKISGRDAKIIWFEIIILVLIIGFLLIMLSRTKIEGEINCNSGKIGLNYSGNWSEAKINGIDNLSCDIKFKSDVPTWIFFIK